MKDDETNRGDGMNIKCFLFGHVFENRNQAKFWKYKYCIRENCNHQEINEKGDENIKKLMKEV